MGVRSQTYDAPPGEFKITIPELAYRKIISVKREGLGYDIVTETPGNRQVQYVPGSGRFIFLNDFSKTISPRPTPGPILWINEKIFIIWQE